MPLFYGRKKEKRRVLKSLEKYTVCAQILSTESRRCFKLILAINVVTRSLGGCFLPSLFLCVYAFVYTLMCARVPFALSVVLILNAFANVSTKNRCPVSHNYSLTLSKPTIIFGRVSPRSDGIGRTVGCKIANRGEYCF